ILTLRDIQKEFSEIESTLQSIKQNGYINYYGEQRFGHDNLSLATQWIKGTYTPKRHEKGFLYSVIRAYLFNAYIDDRLAQGTFEKPLIGDIVSLSHGSSFFKVDSAAEKDIKARFEKGEILLAAPLIGKAQKLHYDDEALQSYLRFCEPYQEYIDFLNSENLEMQFRATKVLPENLSYQYNENDNTLVLHFTLIKGAYATTLVDALN
ncbi:tRNA pseudouridine(13) synthase TruD, partial [Fangia hongkongensis]